MDVKRSLEIFYRSLIFVFLQQVTRTLYKYCHNLLDRKKEIYVENVGYFSINKHTIVVLVGLEARHAIITYYVHISKGVKKDIIVVKVSIELIYQN